MITIENVEKQFERVLFKSDIIQLPSVGIVDLIAPSGAGKTTLFNMLKGIDRNFKGDILIDNVSVKKKIPLKVGYLSQNLLFVDTKTVSWHFKTVVKHNPVRKKEMMTLIDKLRLYEILSSYPCDLSNGERKRVAFALLCLLDNSILLLDEPFADLMEDDIAYIRDAILVEGKKRLIIVSNHIVRYRFHEDLLEINEGVLTYHKEKENEEIKRKKGKINISINPFNIYRFVFKLLSLSFIFLSLLTFNFSTGNIYEYEIKRLNYPIVELKREIPEENLDDIYDLAKKTNVDIFKGQGNYVPEFEEFKEKYDDVEADTRSFGVYYGSKYNLSFVNDYGNNTYQIDNKTYILQEGEIIVTDAWAKMNYEKYGLNDYRDFVGNTIKVGELEAMFITPIEGTDRYDIRIEKEAIDRKVVGMIPIKVKGFDQFYELYLQQKEGVEFDKETLGTYNRFLYQFMESSSEMILHEYLSFAFSYSIDSTPSPYIWAQFSKNSRISTFISGYAKLIGNRTPWNIPVNEYLSAFGTTEYGEIFLMLDELKLSVFIIFAFLSIVFCNLALRFERKEEKRFAKFYNILGLSKWEIWIRSIFRICIDVLCVVLISPFIFTPMINALNKKYVFVASLNSRWLLPIIGMILLVVEIGYAKWIQYRALEKRSGGDK